MESLAALLQAEDDPEILGFRFAFDDLLMWPFIRSYLFEKAISGMYRWAAHPGGFTGRRGVVDTLGYFYRSWRKRPEGTNIGRKHSDIVIFTGGISNIKRGNCYLNKISDYFAFEFPDRTLVIEDSDKGRFHAPRCFPNVLYHDILVFESYLARKIPVSRNRDAQTIGSFMNYLKEKIPWSFEPAVWGNASAVLSDLSLCLRMYKRFYGNIFDAVQPKLILLEDGCYGRRSYLLKWAKERGIHTAEPQHGVLYRNHYAYNYGEGILQSAEYRRHFPDSLLTYGPYWNSKTNVPSEKVVIGNPHYCENSRIAGGGENRPPGKSVILIASSSTDPGMVTRFALSLARIADPERFEIRFRPHPSERPLLRERYWEVIESGRIGIDEESDIHSSLAGAEYLVSEPSTVVYEALGKCDRIFLLDVPSAEFYFPDSPFPKISTGEEMFGAPEEPLARESGFPHGIDSIWNTEWKLRYRNFVNSLPGWQPAMSSEDGRKNP